MIEFTPGSALAGGAVIGLSAVLLLRLNGRIAGISGILNGAMTTAYGDRLWRLLFLIGLVAGGFMHQAVTGDTMVTRADFPYSQLIIAGLLVGFGTRLGSGCTSGHGVSGISRLSRRSIVATCVFLGVGMITASIVYLASGGAS